ncbi:MAG: hypothetical protein ACLRS8_18785 [Parabacteroides merdae]
MFGYPEWQTYTRDCLEDFYALNTYIYSNFYADNLSKEVADFYTKYKNWYSKNLINIFPKYGILGFDTGMFSSEQSTNMVPTSRIIWIKFITRAYRPDSISIA